MSVYKVNLTDKEDFKEISKLTDTSKVHVVTDKNNNIVILTDSEKQFKRIRHYDIVGYFKDYS